MSKWIRDVALMIAVMALLVATMATSPDEISTAGYALVMLSGVSMAVLRLYPVAIVVLTTVCTLTVYVLDRPNVPIELPLLCALFAVLRAGHKLIGVGAGVTYLLTMLVINVAILPGHPAREEIQDRILLLGWFVAAMFMGHAARMRDVRAAELVRSHEETLRRRAGEERLRIARELHDSLTHSISVIKVQAGVAVHLARKRGDDVPEALLAIQEASRDAVRELRQTLSVLRDEPDTSGLDRLDDLVERARSAGLPIQLSVTGEQRSLPEEIDQAAYRIVQEALTNITRHAGAASVKVHLGYGKQELTVQIDDDGCAEPGSAPVPGLGLIGMRERTTALGGALSAEPKESGGFRVRAKLPVR